MLYSGHHYMFHVEPSVRLRYMAHPAINCAQSPQDRKVLRMASNARRIIESAASNPDGMFVWPSPIKRALDACTHKQRHLAICLASGMADVPAYRVAYNVRADREDRSMYGEAYTVCNHTAVLNACSLLRDWLDTAWLLDNAQAVDYGLSMAYEIATTSSDDRLRLRAAETILRVNGAFVSRSEVRHVHSVDTSSLDTLFASMGTMLGLAVPKPPQQIEAAAVESVEFTEPE